MKTFVILGANLDHDDDQRTVLYAGTDEIQANTTARKTTYNAIEKEVWFSGKLIESYRESEPGLWENVFDLRDDLKNAVEEAKEELKKREMELAVFMEHLQR